MCLEYGRTAGKECCGERRLRCNSPVFQESPTERAGGVKS